VVTNRPGKPGIFREFSEPGKFRELSENSMQFGGKIVTSKIVLPDVVSRVQNALIYVCGQSSAPDLAGELTVLP